MFLLAQKLPGHLKFKKHVSVGIAPLHTAVGGLGGLYFEPLTAWTKPVPRYSHCPLPGRG